MQPALGHSTSVDPLFYVVSSAFEEALRHSPVDPTASFFDSGGDSLAAVVLVERLAEVTGRRLALRNFFMAPTVESLIAEIRRAPRSGEPRCVVPITPGSRTPLYCVHAIGGNVVWYRHLANAIDRERPFFGVQAYGLDPDVSPHNSIEAMASHYLNEILCRRQGPFILAGYSFGGIVAFEMARQLAARRLPVPPLLLLDTAWDDGESVEDDPHFALRHVLAILNLRSHFDRIAAEPPAKRLDTILRTAIQEDTLPSSFELRSLERLHQLYDLNFNALRRYRPGLFEHPLALVRAQNELAGGVGSHSDYGWGRLGARVWVFDTPGDHDTFIDPPFVTSLGARIEQAIDALTADNVRTDNALREEI